MTAVIKSGAALSGLEVRGLAAARATAPISPEARLLADLRDRLAASEAEITDLRREKTRAEAALEGARREGHAAGVIEGRNAAEDKSAQLVKTIHAAAADALSSFNTAVSELEAATGELTALALERITGDSVLRTELILATARRAVRLLIADTLVAVEVSGRDFADDVPPADLAPSGCVVRIRADLPSGACRLRLSLGEIDLDLDAQTARLRTQLSPLAGRER